MLATQSSDLRGIEEQEFQEIGVYLAKFLLRSEDTRERVKRKRQS